MLSSSTWGCLLLPCTQISKEKEDNEHKKFVVCLLIPIFNVVHAYRVNKLLSLK